MLPAMADANAWPFQSTHFSLAAKLPEYGAAAGGREEDRHAVPAKSSHWASRRSSETSEGAIDAKSAHDLRCADPHMSLLALFGLGAMSDLSP
jgi:hypothetical protein